MKKVIVLGSGIQGVCCAAALSHQGYDVTIVEKAKEVFARTSKNNEGRVHLGFTYALDRSTATGALVMQSALHFSSIFEEWFGKVDWSRYLLAKGYYLVHKSSSLLTEEELISYYEQLGTIYSNYINNDDTLSYFGSRPKRLFKVLNALPTFISDVNVSRVITTEERIVEMIYFRDLLLSNLKRMKIKVLTETEAKLVERKGRGFIVLASTKGSQELKLQANIVVNCLWNNRIVFDKHLGITTLKNPLYRFKYGILGKVATTVPNCTIVSGAFGNVSPRLDGRHAYISWHPECMRAISTDGTTPPAWENAFEKNNIRDVESPWVKNTINSLKDFVPGLATFKPYKVLPGIICSAGTTDIQDKDSQVHRRAAHMGIYSFDGYFSVDTGKFASAPLFAKKLAKMIGTP